jgi:hypothetical protein
MTTNDTLSLIVRDPNGQDVAAVRWTIDAERIASSYGAGATVRYRSGETLWTVPARYVRGDGDAAITFAIVALATKQAETAAAIGDLEAMMREQFPAPAVDVRNRGDRHRAGYCTHGVDLKLACSDCTAAHGDDRPLATHCERCGNVLTGSERRGLVCNECLEKSARRFNLADAGRCVECGEPLNGYQLATVDGYHICESCDPLSPIAGASHWTGARPVETDLEREHREYCEASMAAFMVCQHGRTDEEGCEDCDELAASLAPRQNEPDVEDASKYATCDEYHSGVFSARPVDYDYLDEGAGELGSDFAGATVLEGADRAEFGPKL